MNTKLIQSTKTKSLPHLPVLVVGKHRRVFTKHYSNLSLWLPGDELSLISFLIYDTETLADNSFEYSTELLNRFIAAFREANLQYNGVSTSKKLVRVRGCFKNLIERGLILNAGKRYMINPMLTYNSDVVNNKKYKEVQELYQVSGTNHISDMTKHFSKLVADYLESKKKNYKYGRKAG